MTRVWNFCKEQTVLVISLIAAGISCFLVPPSAAYAKYIDMRTLALLYCLMVVVAGFCKAGLFKACAQTLCSHAGSARTLGLILVALCFFSSMLITNDVALLTFVPFAVVVLTMAHEEKELIWVVVLQTVAANMGSMLTPVGNPQNLFLHSFYNIPNTVFFSSTFPVWAASLLCTGLLCFALPRHKLDAHIEDKPHVEKKPLPVYAFLLIVCLAVVFRLISWPWMLAILAGVLFLYDRTALKNADFALLATFVCFFIFAGNLARIDAIATFMKQLLSGHEYLTSMLVSQVISNVPAALLLSGFTNDAKSVLLGVDIGGLGTPVASLASLISLKLYSDSQNARPVRYLAVFLAVNIALLIIFSLIFAE
ncbi:MAG: citrate transporter [bacterium]|nr:citrate transporter [bacterium]